MNPPDTLFYEFGDFRIDVGKRLLFKGDGESLQLTPKVFDTLLYLVEHRGEVVGKDELMSAVWPDTVVEENNLSQNISVLRKVLGERPGDHRYIVTVPGRGYEFVAAVQVASNVPEPESVSLGASETSRAWLIRLAIVVCVSFLVLGFQYRDQLVADVKAFFFWSNRAPEPLHGEISVTPLTSGINVQALAISRDGKSFVYHTFDDGHYRIFRQQVGQLNAVEILPATKLAIGAKTFSPDGSYVYYTSRAEGETDHSIYRISSLGGSPKKVVSGISQHSAVSFSPDGTEFVFSHYDQGTKVSSIKIARTDGTGERSILSSSVEELNYPAWSPDGGTIAYARARPKEKPKDQFVSIEAVSVHGGPTRTLLVEKLANCFRIEWISRGDGIVFGGTKLGEHMSGRRDQVWFASLATGKIRRISPEGSRYLFDGLTSDNEAIIWALNRSSQIWEMDANGDSRTATRLTKGTTDGRTGIAPLPDGRVGYMLRNGDDWEIWTMNADGSGQTQIFNENPIIEELRATPDGKHFVFNAEVNGNYQIFRLNTDGSGLKQITSEDEVYAGDPSPSSDSRSVVFGRTAYIGDTPSVSLSSVPIDGGEPLPVDGATVGAYTPHCSPDGKYISFVDAASFPLRVGLLRISDASVRFFPVVQHQQLNVGAIWTPDGKALAYIADDGKVGNVWIQPIDGGPPRRLTDFTSGWIYRIAYSADGKRLYLARGFSVNEALLVKGFAN